MHLAYFPSLSTLSNYCRSTNEVCFDFNQRYERQTDRNHTIIASANGPLKLSVPVSRPNGGQSLYAEILVDDSKKWRLEHWRGIQAAYKHAPYFDHYSNDIEAILFANQKYLKEINHQFIEFILNHLDLGSLKKTGNESFVFTPNPSFYTSEPIPATYTQVFDKQNTTTKSLSTLDGLFNLGPLVRTLL